MAEPIPFTVTRYRCPTCPRTGSSKARIAEHHARCWTNPEARGCKTCKHFDGPVPEWGDACDLGVSLAGQKQCARCFGIPDPFGFGCPDAANHDGDGREIKPGPIVGCDQWEPFVEAVETVTAFQDRGPL